MDFNSPPLEPLSVRVHNLYSPFLRSLSAQRLECASVTLSSRDYANAIRVSLSVQRHCDESEANLTCYTSHLQSCVQHKNTNVPALTQRDSE